MIDLARDLRIARAIAADLKAYLLSDSLYWQLSDHGPASHPFPLGTLGGLLFRLHRLEALASRLAPDQYQQLAGIRTAADQTLSEWVVQAEARAVREITARLTTWGAYLEEVTADVTRFAPEYPTQAEGRVIVALLLKFAGRATDGHNLNARLSVLDKRLADISGQSDFVWDESLASAFPRDPYWWLYVRPRPLT